MGDLLGTPDGALMGGEIGVTAAGQKPQASGHKAPTSKPAFRFADVGETNMERIKRTFGNCFLRGSSP